MSDTSVHMCAIRRGEESDGTNSIFYADLIMRSEPSVLCLRIFAYRQYDEISCVNRVGEIENGHNLDKNDQ